MNWKQIRCDLLKIIVEYSIKRCKSDFLLNHSNKRITIFILAMDSFNVSMIHREFQLPLSYTTAISQGYSFST